MKIGMNTSTLRGHHLSLPEEIEITARASYQGIEPWIRELDAYEDAGYSLKTLRTQFQDAGLDVVNAIGFFEWAVDDPARRMFGLQEARRNMAMCAEIGCPYLAAPPFGATDAVHLTIETLAERYAALLALGDEMGVTPVLEFWGMSQVLNRLSIATAIAMETGHPKACVLGDVFHMYKGGSPFEGLKLTGPQTLALLHINDYPASPPCNEITDAQRVYPGDGIAPLKTILCDLKSAGFDGYVSLELFNEAYWAQDAAMVAKTGADKIRALLDVME